VLFICFALFLILFFTIGHYWFLILFSFLFLISFIVLVTKQNILEDNIVVLASKIQINQDELLFLNHNYHHRESGSEYETLNPFLSNDFNLFGKGSLFQYLNRCNTNFGKKIIAQNLCNMEKDAILISRKQSAINEFCTNNDYVQNFQSFSRLLSDNKNELSFLLSWITEPYENLKKITNIAFILATINIIWLLLSTFGILTWASFLIPIIFSQLVNYFNKNKILKYNSRINESVGALVKYVKLLKLIEDEHFESEHLRLLQRELLIHDTKASISLNSLFKILDVFIIKNNALIHSLLNIFLLIDIHICYQLLEWRKKQKDEVEKWFSTIGEIEVLISFATYAFNNKESVTFPSLSDSFYKIKAIELGHPLLHPNVRVNNNFSITGAPSIQIITGANMAGKSTFLRTLAVNLILAMNGAPVIAKEFSFFPCDILSSIKVQDSLTNNESYFYAELLRLKDIIEHVKSNPNTLVILDEILRGTNTKDKQTGSLGFLEKLIQLNAMVIVATHDLVIGELEQKYPYIASNNCFEVELIDDQLFFDYKLKEGISKKLNASFLMKKMEIID
jgi:DNA mismatch repair ATPase MutS